MPKYIFSLDTTSSGLSLKGDDQILSITILVIEYEKKKIIDELSLNISYRGDVSPSPSAILINRKNTLRHKGLSEQEAAEQLSHFMKKYEGSLSPLLGRNISFDRQLLVNLFYENGINPDFVSEEMIDVVLEAARAINKNTFPLEKLKEKSEAGATKKSYELSYLNIFYALQVPPLPGNYSKDRADAEMNFQAWLRLLSPLAKKSNIDNISFLQEKYNDKVLLVKEWDEAKGWFVIKKYFVCGFGYEPGVVNSFNNKTVLLNLSVISSQEIFSRLLTSQKARKENRSLNPDELGITNKFLKQFYVEKDLYKNETVVFKEDESFNEKDLEKLRQLKEYVYSYFITKQNKSIKDYSYFVSKYNENPFNAENFSSIKEIYEDKDFEKIPYLAHTMMAFNELERSKFISKEANKPQVKGGQIWCFQMMRGIEKYGYRNKIKGYENARTREIKRVIPLNPEVVSKKIDPIDCPPSIKKVCREKSIYGIELLCDGASVSLRTLSDSYIVMNQKTLDYKTINSHFVLPSFEEIFQSFRKEFPVTKEDMIFIFKDFQIYIDDKSFFVIKQQLEKYQKNADILLSHVFSEVLSDMINYPTFLQNISLKRSNTILDEKNQEIKEGTLKVSILEDTDKETANRIKEMDFSEDFSSEKAIDLEDENDDEGSKKEKLIKTEEDGTKVYQTKTGGTKLVYTDGRTEYKYNHQERYVLRKNNFQKIKKDFTPNKDAHGLAREIFMEYNKLQGFDSKDLHNLSDLEILALNLQNPYAKNAIMLDKEVRKHAVGEELFNIKAILDEGHEENLDDKMKCKICNRELSLKNSVAGMGPECAKTLAVWINKSFTNENLEKKKFKKMSECSSEEIFPLMLVKNIENNKVFAADLRQQQEDGRFLVIDLTETDKITKEQNVKNSVLFQASQIYLDPQDHEVASIFEDNDQD